MGKALMVLLPPPLMDAISVIVLSLSPPPLFLSRKPPPPLHLASTPPPNPPHKQNLSPWGLQVCRAPMKLNAVRRRNPQPWKKGSTRTDHSLFSDHFHWPSLPFLLVLSLYRALPISCSFFSVACPRWLSSLSHPVSVEFGIHLPSG